MKIWQQDEVEGLVGKKLTPITESTSDNRIFSSDDECIVKCFGELNAFQRELSVLQSLKSSTSLSVPTYLSSIECYDSGIIIMTKVQGMGLKYCWNNRVSDVKEKALGSISTLMRQIHTVQVEHIPLIEEIWKENIKEYRQSLMASPYDATTWSGDLLRLEELVAKCGVCVDSVVNHGDLWIANVLAREDGSISLIDWEKVYRGPRQGDFYRLFHHRYFAQQEHDRIEEEVMQLLIVHIQNAYPVLMQNYSADDFRIYAWMQYFSSFAQREEKRYTHEDNIKFIEAMEKVAIQIEHNIIF